MGGIAQDAAFFALKRRFCGEFLARPPGKYTKSWKVSPCGARKALLYSQTKISVQGEVKSLTGGDVPRCTKQQGEVRDPGRLQAGGPVAAAPQPVRLIW